MLPDGYVFCEDEDQIESDDEEDREFTGSLAYKKFEKKVSDKKTAIEIRNKLEKK